MNIYEQAKMLGLTNKDRWGQGIEHHPKSEELMRFIAEHDFNDYGDYFCWKIGGDGDNGETLMYMMDAYFELMDILDNPGHEGRGRLTGEMDNSTYQEFMSEPPHTHIQSRTIVRPACKSCGTSMVPTWHNGVLGPGYAEGNYVCPSCGRCCI
jgi:hypothetical protein